MNKRLRKKLKKREFNWLGFEVECTFDPPIANEAVEPLCDDFIRFVEANDLATGGVTRPDGLGHYISKMPSTLRRRRTGKPQFKYGHCTEADREKVRAWFADKPFAKNVVVGPLVGGWG